MRLKPTSDLTNFYSKVESGNGKGGEGPLEECYHIHSKALKEALGRDENAGIVAMHHIKYIMKALEAKGSKLETREIIPYIEAMQRNLDEIKSLDEGYWGE